MRVLLKFVENENKLNKFMSKGYKLSKVYHGALFILYWFEECKNEQFMVCILHHDDEKNCWESYKKRDVLIDKYRNSGAVIINAVKRNEEDYKSIQQKDFSINNAKGSLYYIVLPKRKLTREEKELSIWHISDYKKRLFWTIGFFLISIKLFIEKIVSIFTINFEITAIHIGNLLDVLLLCVGLIFSIISIRLIILYIKARTKEKKVYKDVQDSYF